MTLLWLVKKYRSDIQILIEQPGSSFMFKIGPFRRVAAALGLKKVLTHQGLFGGPVLKATHLMSNMRSASSLERRATKNEKKKFKRRIARKEARLAKQGRSKPIYWKRLPGGKFQGGPNLAETALYPFKFCNSIVSAWEQTFPFYGCGNKRAKS